MDHELWEAAAADDDCSDWDNELEDTADHNRDAADIGVTVREHRCA